MDFTKEECESLIESGGETNFWHVTPSGDIRDPPDLPKEFEAFDPHPERAGTKYWFIRKIT